MLTELLATAGVASTIGYIVGARFGLNKGWEQGIDRAIDLDRCTECSGSMRGPFHEADCSMMPVRLAPPPPEAAEVERLRKALRTIGNFQPDAYPGCCQRFAKHARGEHTS